MKYLTRPITALFVAATLSGCVVVNGKHSWANEDWINEQRENREIISKLEIGMARGDVVSQLGTPTFSEAFTREGDEYRVLFFRTHHRHADGDTSRDETTPLVFKNDSLVGWGEDTLASIR